MQITHYCNAFVSVKINRSVIVCDPWVGPADENSWVTYPVHKNGISILNNLNPNFIYISHLHCDHFDPKILSKFKNKNVNIIIKKFHDQILKRRIFKLGFQNIFECKPWKKYKVNKDISLAIIPQMTSNTGGIMEQIDYDLDTSIVIQSNHNKEVFFNEVDNPLSLNDLKKVKTFITKYFNKKVGVVCTSVGVASEYPQCFLNIDRKKEKKKMINACLSILKKKLNIIQPKVFFQAAGLYIISGKYFVLNKYLAVPNIYQIKKFLKNQNYKVANMDGGILTQKKGDWFLKRKRPPKNKFHKKKIINLYKNKKYFYFKDYRDIRLEDIDSIFYNSYSNYTKTLTRFPFKTNWITEFYIYRNLFVDLKGKINFRDSKFLKKYVISHNKTNGKSLKNNYSKLKCHLDFNLFYGLLKKKYIWNCPSTGTLILYERKPNKFNVNQNFSLNFLHL